MKRTILTAICASMVAIAASAQQKMVLHMDNGQTQSIETISIDSISFSSDAKGAKMVINLKSDVKAEFNSIGFENITWEQSDAPTTDAITSTGSVLVLSDESAVVTMTANIADIYSEVGKAGIYYSTWEEPLYGDGISKFSKSNLAKLKDNGVSSYKIEKLKPNTTYYYRSYVYNKNTREYTYGEVKSFTTEPETVDLPSKLIGNLTCYSAEIESEIKTSVRTIYTPTGYGIIYGTNEDPTTKGTRLEATSKSGSVFTTTLKGLNGNTTYFYCPYTSYNGEFIYGEVKSFTTLEDNVVVTGDIDPETNGLITKYNIGNGAYEKWEIGLESWVLENNPYNNTEFEYYFADQSEGEVSMYLSSAIGDIAYRVFAIIDGSYHYGETKIYKAVLHDDYYINYWIKEDPNLELFSQAMEITHMFDSTSAYYDHSYVIPPFELTNKGEAYSTGYDTEYGVYPKYRYFKYTILAETDEVFRKAGINSLEDLKAYAKKVYDESYPEDAGKYDDDYTDRRNPLNRFISYHLLPEYLGWNNFTLNSSDYVNNYVGWQYQDYENYYETMLPNSIIRASNPITGGIYINRKGNVENYVSKSVDGNKITNNFEYGDSICALNGVCHYIDNILVYSKETREEALNTRIRVFANSLSPDFINSGAWPRYYSSSVSMRVIDGYAKNFKADDKTKIYVRPSDTNFSTYFGSEMVALGDYDFSIKLPPVPTSGEYEIRFQYYPNNDNALNFSI